MSNIELWGNDGQQDKKLCAVETKRDGTIIAEALLLAQRLGKQGFAVQHLWLQEAGKRGSIMLAHWPADGSLWGRECTPPIPHIENVGSLMRNNIHWTEIILPDELHSIASQVGLSFAETQAKLDETTWCEYILRGKRRYTTELDGWKLTAWKEAGHPGNFVLAERRSGLHG